MRQLRRWGTFNIVGLAGALIQLATLATLTNILQMSLWAATVLAVESAILHNFAWHQRWTWRDRPSSGPRATLARLVRFHAVNGMVSLLGNVFITVALVRTGLDPLIANLVAIITCSLINFAAGDWLVFRQPVLVSPSALQARFTERGPRTTSATTSP